MSSSTPTPALVNSSGKIITQHATIFVSHSSNIKLEHTNPEIQNEDPSGAASSSSSSSPLDAPLFDFTTSPLFPIHSVPAIRAFTDGNGNPINGYPWTYPFPCVIQGRELQAIRRARNLLPGEVRVKVEGEVEGEGVNEKEGEVEKKNKGEAVKGTDNENMEHGAFCCCFTCLSIVNERGVWKGNDPHGMGLEMRGQDGHLDMGMGVLVFIVLASEMRERERE
ncbi:MAG: hypothetical protein M1834_002054 [Cirrosporium novae-zelandiae]|nr:MAG: hypothetical protein M1834_002054 [Cirrosporium novae-zelandiae]